MTTALALVGFADDPVAPHSAQFPLGRIGGGAETSGVPSQPDVRPWGYAECGRHASRATLFARHFTMTMPPR